MLVIHDLPQGSPEWFDLRAGMITASGMKNVLAKGKGKTRKTYMYKLIGEVFTGEYTEGFSNAHTDRGHELEPEARALYESELDCVVSECGFMVETDINVGYSPDGVTDDGLLEIKTRLPHLMAETLDTQKVPSEHKAQIQCGLWVTGKEWLDFVAYWPGMPVFIQRVTRDDEYIKTMGSECEQFYSEMNEIMDRISKG